MIRSSTNVSRSAAGTRQAAADAFGRPRLITPLLADTPTKTLSVPAKVKWTGMETKLINQGVPGAARRETDRSLLRLMGQARRFSDLVLAGRGKTITELARDAGVSPSYFTRVYRLSFLAPTIVKTILQCREPAELTANRLMLRGKLALAWSEQQAQQALS
jgi:site-specific DNA recombinase